MRDHCLARLQHIELSDEDLNFSDSDRAQLVFDNDYLYKHATVQFNYTTYDVRRERDVVKPGSAIMLPNREDSDDTAGDVRHPFWYAVVLGIHHVRVSHAPTQTQGLRMDFLWVRWLGLDPDWKGGDSTCQLERVGFVPFGNDAGGPAFGFVDPATVIRACHLIPAFAEGTTTGLMPPSKFRQADGDYVNFYVNRYAETTHFIIVFFHVSIVDLLPEIR